MHFEISTKKVIIKMKPAKNKQITCEAYCCLLHSQQIPAASRCSFQPKTDLPANTVIEQIPVLHFAQVCRDTGETGGCGTGATGGVWWTGLP